MFVSRKQPFTTEQYHPEIDLGPASESNLYSGFADPLEDGGIFVATHVPRKIGERLRVKFEVPGYDDAFEAKVEVRWLRERDEAGEISPGFGAAFVELGEDARAAVARLMVKRTPIFYAE